MGSKHPFFIEKWPFLGRKTAFFGDTFCQLSEPVGEKTQIHGFYINKI